jgi:hypothetical protein
MMRGFEINLLALKTPAKSLDTPLPLLIFFYPPLKGSPILPVTNVSNHRE